MGQAPSLPPGPRRWPLVGSMPFLGADLPRDAMRFSNDLNSDIIYIKVGSMALVLLNSMEAVEEAFSGDNFNDRPKSSLFLMIKDFGITNQNGKVWLQHRHFLQHFLKDNIDDYDRNVREELPNLLKEIAARGQSEFDVSPLFSIATGNVATMKLFSHRYDYSDHSFLTVVTRMAATLSLIATPGMKVAGMFPSLLPYSGNWKTVKHCLGIVHTFIEGHIKEHEGKYEPGNITDLLDAYLTEKERADKEGIPFSDEQMRDVIIEVLTPVEDLVGTLRWAILYMILHPDVQKKVQSEIDTNIGKTELPSFKDRSKLPYTAATIMEVQRLCSLAPLGLPRANLENDVKLRSFTIPAGTAVLPNSYAIHRDPKLWKHPDEFNPDNFLGDSADDAKLERKRGFMGHSFGQRMCPGYEVAQVELFVFFSALLQSFEFSVPTGSPQPSQEAILKGTRLPHPFKVCAKARTDE